jgi:hypothetical protein
MKEPYSDLKDVTDRKILKQTTGAYNGSERKLRGIAGISPWPALPGVAPIPAIGNGAPDAHQA